MYQIYVSKVYIFLERVPPNRDLKDEDDTIRIRQKNVCS